MKNELTCGVVRDLLPSYAEHLTCEESDEAIRNHLVSCEACQKLYREMVRDETTAESEGPEIDYLKKIQRSRRRLWTVAICALLLAAAGLSMFLLQKKGDPRYEIHENNLIITGTGNYDTLKLPEKVNEAVNLEVQDDQFHLSAYLPAIRDRLAVNSGTENRTYQEFLPGYLDRTEKSLVFLRDFLRQNAPRCYEDVAANKFVDISVRALGRYSYRIEEERILLQVGDFYWHWEEAYLLALMNPKTVEWPQLGYAWYLIYQDPNMESWGLSDSLDLSGTPYGESYLAAGGALTELETEDCMKLADAISYTCLTQGMHWGTAYESYPITETYWFNGPGKDLGGNGMSVLMATSFIGWLAERYGIENTTEFCFGRISFQQAFGTDYQTAYDAWNSWILTTYAP